MRPTTQFEHRPGILDLGWGHPLPALLPVEEWAVASSESARAHGPSALTYGYAAGPAPFLDWLCAHLDDGTTPDQVFVTGGASHALDLVVSVLSRPGDTVLVDSPTYHLAPPILTDRGLRVRPASGAGPDARLRYTVPTFANPTGRSLPVPDRLEAIEAARRGGVTIVEDDTYRELAYDGPAPPSMWELSGGDGSVVRLGSFAKTVAPGLRLGWINATPPLIARLASLGYVHSGGGVNHATAMTMAAFGKSGAYLTHVAAARTAYQKQRDALVSALRGSFENLDVPRGGWFLWVRLPGGRTAARLLPIAERNGVSFVPGPAFFVDGGGSDRIRLSFSHLPPQELVVAASRLGDALRADDR
jgi:DNA-binding transcriptional MocR family regulator